MWNGFWKNLRLILINFAYINSSLTFFNFFYFIIFFFSYVWTGGFLVYVWLILEVAYFIFWLWKNIFYQLNNFRLRNFILDSPISMIIGKLGTGKTLLLTYLNEIMQTKSSHVYTNYPINDKNTKIITFKHFDFNDKTKLIPPNNSFIGFDESFLYMDGTDPKTTKLIHNGKIPYILLARHFNNNLCITAQRPNMVWNNIRELATCTIIPLSLKKPPNGKTLIPKFFIMELGVFQDMDMYEIWKNKSMERVSDGKKSKRKSDMGLGVKFFK